MRCASCGHLRDSHLHYRPGSDCSENRNGRCLCMAFAHPIPGWAFHVWDRIMDGFRRG